MSKAGKERKKLNSATRHQFLLTFFPQNDRYEVVELNGFILVKQFNRDVQRWEVAIWNSDKWYQLKGSSIAVSKPVLTPVDDTGEPIPQ